MTSEILIQKLLVEIEQQKILVQTKLYPISEERLNHKSSPETWSILECLAHLNSYSAHYLPSFEKAMQEAESKGFKPEKEFYSTWLGRFSIQSVLPENINKKMKAVKKHNHLNSQLSKNEIKQFEDNLNRLSAILKKSNRISLNKTKVRIEVMPIFKLRLGDIFQFMVYHQSRHLLQATNLLQQI